MPFGLVPIRAGSHRPYNDNSLTFTIGHFNKKADLIEVAICEALMLDYALKITKINNELISDAGRKHFQF